MERVRRAIGPEQADRILEAAYQQEQVEKEAEMGCKVKNEGRRHDNHKKMEVISWKSTSLTRATVCGMSCRGTNNIRACAAEIVDTEIICA